MKNINNKIWLSFLKSLDVHHPNHFSKVILALFGFFWLESSQTFARPKIIGSTRAFGSSLISRFFPICYYAALFFKGLAHHNAAIFLKARLITNLKWLVTRAVSCGSFIRASLGSGLTLQNGAQSEFRAGYGQLEPTSQIDNLRNAT